MRAANVVLGIWLFLSAFLLPHNSTSQTNTWIVGILIAGVATLAMYTPSIRWVNAALAVWLFLSTIWLYPATTATSWNNTIVAIAVLLVSLMPTQNTVGRGVNSP
jgi:hypothetical protein